jgi:hypothetical protein
MAIAKRTTGKYIANPVGGLKLMSRMVKDKDYKLHGREQPIYIYYFYQDEAGNRFGISKDGGSPVKPEYLDEWERKLIM